MRILLSAVYSLIVVSLFTGCGPTTTAKRDVVVAIDNGWDPSIFVDTGGNPSIAYTAKCDINCLKYAKYINGQWRKEYVDFSISSEPAPSMVVNSKGIPYIFYASASDVKMNLRMARKESGDWSINSLTDLGDNQESVGAAIDKTDLIHVAYHFYRSITEPVETIEKYFCLEIDQIGFINSTVIEDFHHDWNIHEPHVALTAGHEKHLWAMFDGRIASNKTGRWREEAKDLGFGDIIVGNDESIRACYTGSKGVFYGTFSEERWEFRPAGHQELEASNCAIATSGDMTTIAYHAYSDTINEIRIIFHKGSEWSSKRIDSNGCDDADYGGDRCNSRISIASKGDGSFIVAWARDRQIHIATIFP